jgi:hypothetical protein
VPLLVPSRRYGPACGPTLTRPRQSVSRSTMTMADLHWPARVLALSLRETSCPRRGDNGPLAHISTCDPVVVTHLKVVCSLVPTAWHADT